MSSYGLIYLARDIAKTTRQRNFPRALVLALADELEQANTKLRDKEWDYQWDRKQLIAK